MKKIINSLLSFNKKMIEKIGIKNIKIIYAITTILLCSGVCFIGVYKGHDIKFQVDRFKSLYLSLKEGYFPTLIYPNYLEGYGYPLGIFYPDVFLYIPALIALVIDKIPFMRIEMAYNAFLIMVNIFAAYTTYKCIKTITKNDLCAMVFARVLVISPYFLNDAYTRSALGEHIAFSFIPLVILGLYELTYGDCKRKGIYFTLGLLGIVLSHVLSVLMCAIFVFIFFIFNFKKYLEENERFKYLIIYGLFSIALSLWYILPMYEMLNKDTYLYNYGWSLNGISAASVKLINLFVELKPGNSFSPSIGLIYLFLYILFIFDKNKRNASKFSKDLIYIGTIFLFAATEIFPWKYINMLNIIQFPWRLFQTATAALTIGFSLYFSDRFSYLDNTSKFVLEMKPFLMFSMVLFIYATTLDFDIGFLRKLEYKMGAGEYIPANVGGILSKEKDFAQEFTLNRGQVIESNSDSIICDFAKKGTTLTITYSNNIDENTYLDLPLIYYYGYEAIEDGASCQADRSEQWLVRVYPVNESGVMTVKYGYTTLRKVSIAISSISLLGFVFLITKNRKYN